MSYLPSKLERNDRVPFISPNDDDKKIKRSNHYRWWYCQFALNFLCAASISACIVLSCIDMHVLRGKYSDLPGRWPSRQSVTPRTSSLPVIRIVTDNSLSVSTTDQYTLSRVTCEFGNVTSPNGARAGLRVRGAGSRSFPQQSYNLEFRQESDAEEDAENSLCNISQGRKLEDWRLVQTWSDASALRTKTAFEVWKKLAQERTGFYLQSELVEVVLNEEYIGVFLATEAIKRKAYTFVDADNKTDEHIKSTKASKGLRGILFEKGGSDLCFDDFEMDYPKCSVLRETSFDKNVRNHLRQTTEVLKTNDRAQIETFVDVNSFVDHVLVAELFKDKDAYRRSEYFYIKDMSSSSAEERLLRAGPEWDFDVSAGTIHSFREMHWEGFAFDRINYLVTAMNPWIRSLVEKDWFIDLLKTRFDEKKEILTQIGESVHHLDAASSENHAKNYNLFGKCNLLFEKADGWEQKCWHSTYFEEVGRLKGWLRNRHSWLDKSFAKNVVATVHKPAKSNYIRVIRTFIRSSVPIVLLSLSFLCLVTLWTIDLHLTARRQGSFRSHMHSSPI